MKIHPTHLTRLSHIVPQCLSALWRKQLCAARLLPSPALHPLRLLARVCCMQATRSDRRFSGFSQVKMRRADLSAPEPKPGSFCPSPTGRFLLAAPCVAVCRHEYQRCSTAIDRLPARGDGPVQVGIRLESGALCHRINADAPAESIARTSPVEQP